MARLLREHPEPVAIAPIGPLTNIALLLRLHPELAPRIAHLSIMGGSIGEGNTTVSAEFNIYADPEAADIVFRSGVPITMMGLDVTHQALLDRASAARAAAPAAARPARIAAELTEFALDRNREWYRRDDHGHPRRRRGRPPRDRRTSSTSPRTTSSSTRPTARPAAGRSATASRTGSRRDGRGQRRRRHPHRPGAVRAAAHRRVRALP